MGAVGGGVDFGSDDDDRFVGERVAESGEFAGDDVVGVDGIVDIGVAGVDEMDQQASSFDVLKKTDTESGAQVGTFDQAWKIRDDEAAAEFPAGAAIGVDYAKIGFERGERIVSDFRAGGGDDGNQCGFTSVGKTDEADVGEKFEFEAEMALFAGAAVFVFARSLVPGFGEMLIATPAVTAVSDEHALAGSSQIGDSFAGAGVENDSADGDLQDGIFAGASRAIRALAVSAAVGAKFAIVAVAKEGVVVNVGFEKNATAVAAVAAGGAAARDILLPAEGNAAVAAVATLDKNFCFVCEH